MKTDSAKYGTSWQIKRRRVQREIAAGRGVCSRCGWPIRSTDHWSLSREAEGDIHSRCGFERGLLGSAGALRGSTDDVNRFYSLAFVLGLVGGVAALFAVRRGERSLLAMLAFVPLLVGVSFGLAELLG